MVRSKNNYKLLKSAMICLLMGSALISTELMVAPSYAAEEVGTDPIARLLAVQQNIAEKHADWVYKPIVYNTTEPSRDDTRNFGFVVHEVSKKMGSMAEVNAMLRVLADEDTGKFPAFTIGILQNYFSAAATKINIDETGLLSDIAKEVYALNAFFDIALVGSSYRKVIDFITNQYRGEYDAKKDTQTQVLAGANIEKEQAIAKANSQFESTKLSLETEYKQLTEKNEEIIKGLQKRNGDLMKGAIEPKEVGTNKGIILRKESENVKAKADFEVKVKEATEARDKTIKEANDAYAKIQAKQEAEVREAEIKFNTGADEYKYLYSFFVQELGTSGLKTVGRLVSGKSISRQFHEYHRFNKVLIENPNIMTEARLDLVQDLMNIKGFNEMFHLIGIKDDVLDLLKLRLESKNKELWQKLGVSGSSSGDQKKKSNRKVLDNKDVSSRPNTPVVGRDDYSSQSLNRVSSILLEEYAPSHPGQIDAVKSLIQPPIPPIVSSDIKEKKIEEPVKQTFAEVIKKTSDETARGIIATSEETKAKVTEVRSVVEAVLGAPEKKIVDSAPSSTVDIQDSGSEKKNYYTTTTTTNDTKQSGPFRRRPTRGGSGYPGSSKK